MDGDLRVFESDAWRPQDVESRGQAIERVAAFENEPSERCPPPKACRDASDSRRISSAKKIV